MQIEGVKGKIIDTDDNGILMVQVSKPDRPMVKTFLRKYFNRAKNNAEKMKKEVSQSDYPELTFNFAYWYKERTIDQNSLYHPLKAILAFDYFQEFGHEDEIHEELLSLYSPRVKSPMTGAEVPKRSHAMSTVEFSRLIEGTFFQLAHCGISDDIAMQIIAHWKKWHKWRGEQAEDPLGMTYKDDDDYRARVPFCEACGLYLADGEGQMAHIVSKGSGGSDAGWNKFRLCTQDHIYIQHQNGWIAFLERYPHLAGKVEHAQEKG